MGGSGSCGYCHFPPDLPTSTASSRFKNQRRIKNTLLLNPPFRTSIAYWLKVQAVAPSTLLVIEKLQDYDPTDETIEDLSQKPGVRRSPLTTGW